MHRLNQLLRDRPWLADVPLFALLLFPYPAPFQARPEWKPVWLQVLVFTGVVLPLVWRRRHPEAVAGIVLTASAVQYLAAVTTYDRGRSELAIAVVLYTLVVLGRRRAAVVAAPIVVVLDIVWAYTTLTEQRFPAIFSVLSVHACAWALGEFVRARRALRAEAEERAVAEDRTRIARELHDVIAHSVSVMVVHAEGAKLMRHKDSATIDRTLETISTTGRGALGELRRLLDALGGEPARSPQPTVAELRHLVTQASTGRPEIELTVTGEPGGLPASASLQTYRIVQEALTNVIKHAPADAAARVRVSFGKDITVDVVNTGGSGPKPPALPSSGRGLAGMAQRVEMFRGTLDTGPTADGGYRVRATLKPAS